MGRWTDRLCTRIGYTTHVHSTCMFTQQGRLTPQAAKSRVMVNHAALLFLHEKAAIASPSPHQPVNMPLQYWDTIGRQHP